MLTTTVHIHDGIKVIVPDTLESITTYVLQEQLDWFEEEINAVRSILKPGQIAIDIGANLGVYSLSMAAVVGNSGRVIAFEPSPDVAALLESSAKLNHLHQLEVVRQAVGASQGEARLYIDRNSELSQLVQGNTDYNMPTINVERTSLDEWAVEVDIQGPISFIKMDAEGQELEIIKGAKKLLREQDPIILFEVKHGEDLHLELVEAFAEYGYKSYRLLPGPLLLAPFDPKSAVDGYLLNLFCCKEEKARELQRAGWLAMSNEERRVNEDLNQSWNLLDEKYTWPARLGKFPYVIGLQEYWKERNSPEDSELVRITTAMALHALSCDSTQSPSTRVDASIKAVEIIYDACLNGASPLHLASLARTARDAGLRGLAVEALESLISALQWMNEDDFVEPFLAPCQRFDNVSPNGSLVNWMIVAAIEEHETLRSYSSYFSGPYLRERLSYALGLGFESTLLKRRQDLIERRFPRT